MYFPYLHGKQKEVLALRHLAQVLGAEGQVQPVMEPVRVMATSMRHTLEACEAHRLPVWLVVNPVRQDFDLLLPAEAFDWGRQLFTSLPTRQWIHPTLMLGPALTPDVVRRFVQLFGARPMGLVVGPEAPPLSELMTMLGGARVRQVFFKGVEPTAADRAALGDTACVRVEDRRLPDSPDLRQDHRHPFLDPLPNPLPDLRREGGADFSDYTTLPSRPDTPEAPSRLAAFRLSYLRIAPAAAPAPAAIWLESFLSGRLAPDEDSADQRFRRALRVFQAALDRDDACFGPTEAVRRYLAGLIDGVQPSRALSKQWELMHHLELVSGVLAGRFPGTSPAGVPTSLLAPAAARA
ncbi:hypothetical protein SAMN05428960_0227 [Mitsuaria sp. PDC51]|uniref:sce7725 family protein n=1 Tax=Mitsuaria sp. PDC51 TaxID=1881035 RepID=UPI0008F02F8C|nr:sce7725 family protein [Mitsuaria sp. PDC51]SFR70710.1 hypothetical protein SAMN05428960_0227 [Mitsuaria sp. PDC51]